MYSISGPSGRNFGILSSLRKADISLDDANSANTEPWSRYQNTKDTCQITHSERSPFESAWAFCVVIATPHTNSINLAKLVKVRFELELCVGLAVALAEAFLEDVSSARIRYFRRLTT